MGWAYPTAPTVAGSYRRLDLKPAPDRSVGGLHRTRSRRAARPDLTPGAAVTHPTKGRGATMAVAFGLAAPSRHRPGEHDGHHASRKAGRG